MPVEGGRGTCYQKFFMSTVSVAPNESLGIKYYALTHRFLIKLDTRARPLKLSVNHWAKLHKMVSN